MKQCTGCGNVKPLGEFNRDRRVRDGRESRCRECSRAAHRDDYVYRLIVTYPPNSRDGSWEPPGYDGYDQLDEFGTGEWRPFSWPANRLCLSATTAKRRADLFRKYGATVTVERSGPVTWGAS